VGAEEKSGADEPLITPAGVAAGRNRRRGDSEIFQGQVNLSQAPIRQRDVGLYEEQKAGERAALAEAGLGLFGLGDGAPHEALSLGEGGPTFGDRAESPADRDLGRGAGIKRDKSGVAVLAIAIALLDCAPAFSQLRNLKDSHNSTGGDYRTPGGGGKQNLMES
jgi:hypothetical protein